MTNEINLGWTSLILNKNQKKVELLKPKVKTNAVQMPKEWFKVNSEDFTSVGQQFDKLKITEYLKGIEAAASEVFPFAYDTSSHWFYYVFFNTQSNVTQRDNTIVRRILRGENLRHGMSNDALKRGGIRHPMPNISKQQLLVLKSLRRHILGNFKNRSLRQCENDFRKIWISQITDTNFRHYLLNDQTDLKIISKKIYNRFQISTKRIILSFLIIRAVYGTPKDNDSHKEYCKKVLELIAVSSSDVINEEMGNRIRKLVELSKTKRQAIWVVEAKRAVKDKRPVYRSYRINAFMKVYNQLVK